MVQVGWPGVDARRKHTEHLPRTVRAARVVAFVLIEWTLARSKPSILPCIVGF